MTLEEFRNKGEEIKNQIFRRNDIIDFDNGTMVIYNENLTKYLEKYACKDAEDFENVMWFHYGVFVKIID